MNVLVVNCGSSSLKYQLLDMTNETELAKGLFEKIGDQDAIFTHKRPNADKLERVEPILNHKEALRILLHSTKQCLKKLTCMRFLTPTMKTMAFVAMVSMVHPINM